MDDRNDFSRFLSGTVDKLIEFGGVAKLYAQIKAEEAKKQEQYYRLGKRYYKLFKDSPEKDLRDIVDKLLACDEKIEELKQKLSDSGEDFREVERDTEASKEPEEAIKETPEGDTEEADASEAASALDE